MIEIIFVHNQGEVAVRPDNLVGHPDNPVGVLDSLLGLAERQSSEKGKIYIKNNKYVPHRIKILADN